MREVVLRNFASHRNATEAKWATGDFHASGLFAPFGGRVAALAARVSFGSDTTSDKCARAQLFF